MAKKKKAAASGKEATRKKNTLMVRVSDADHKLLTELAEVNGRKITAENHIALVKHFRDTGKLPPSESAQT